MLAVVLHVLILLYLLFGLDWIKWQKPTEKAAVVQAHVVDADKMQTELNKLKLADAQEKAAKDAALREEDKRLEELKRRQVEEKQRLQQLEKQRQRQEQAKQQREVETKRQEKLKKEQAAQETKRKAEAEAKRKAEVEAKAKAEAKRKAEVEAKAKAEAEAEAKRKAEAQAKAEAEAKRKAEAVAKAEAKRKAEAEAKAEAAAKAEAEAKAKAEAAAQTAREKALQEQLAAEQNGREIDRYAAVIKQQITRSWLRPPNVGQGLSCVVEVRLIPGGDVVPGGVRIIKSSGNAAFDRSVESAVYKATPLPVPSGSLFESFRNFKLYFNPQ